MLTPFGVVLTWPLGRRIFSAEPWNFFSGVQQQDSNSNSLGTTSMVDAWLAYGNMQIQSFMLYAPSQTRLYHTFFLSCFSVRVYTYYCSQSVVLLLFHFYYYYYLFYRIPNFGMEDSCHLSWHWVSKAPCDYWRCPNIWGNSSTKWRYASLLYFYLHTSISFSVSIKNIYGSHSESKRHMQLWKLWAVSLISCAYWSGSAFHPLSAVYRWHSNKCQSSSDYWCLWNNWGWQSEMLW